MLRELIPSDIMKMQSTSEWKRSIVASYNQDGGMSSEDAKVAFLKIVYRYVRACIFLFLCFRLNNILSFSQSQMAHLWLCLF